MDGPTFVVDCLSGVIGGIVVCVLGHPFDTTKTRLQTAPAGFYKNTLDCVRKTWKWEGMSGFYSGIYSPLAGQMFFRAASFSTFFYSLGNLIAMHGVAEPSSKTFLMSGAITGFVISFIEAPIDLLKTKLQVQIFKAKLDPSFKSDYQTTRQCFQHIATRYGTRGLWQGWAATCIRNVPANAMFFPVNEISKRQLASWKDVPVNQLSVPYRFIAGATAGLCYWVGTYPLDVIKGRLQAQAFEQRMSWRDTAVHIWREGGIRNYTRGLAPCAARAVPACSIMFITVDYVREILGGVIKRS